MYALPGYRIRDILANATLPPTLDKLHHRHDLNIVGVGSADTKVPLL
jgi:hypothetical protein